MLIIGCGNLERSDDGAGLLVARRLLELGANALSCEGDPLRLIDLWRQTDHVILVDAVVTGAPVGTIHVWNCQRPSLDSKARASTHGLDIADAIELARILNRLPSRLEVYAIEGCCFERGGGTSREIQHAVDEVVRRILAQH